VKISKVK